MWNFRCNFSAMLLRLAPAPRHVAVAACQTLERTPGSFASKKASILSQLETPETKQQTTNNKMLTTCSFLRWLQTPKCRPASPHGLTHLKPHFAGLELLGRGSQLQVDTSLCLSKAQRFFTHLATHRPAHADSTAVRFPKKRHVQHAARNRPAASRELQAWGAGMVGNTLN